MTLLSRLLGRRRRLALVLADAVLIVSALLLANALRFDDLFPTGRAQFGHFDRWLLLDLVLSLPIFYLLGLYRSAWRYASVRDLVNILKAVIIRTGVVVVACVLLGYHGTPRSVVVMDTVLLFLFVGGIRLATRVQGELQRSRNGGRPVLIVGAGESGEMLVREMRRRPDMDYLPVAFVDDDPEKHGINIHGVPVVGGREEIGELIRSRGVAEVIVAIPSASARDLRDIRARIGDQKVRFKAVPAVAELLGADAGLRQVREVAVEDLLGREAVVLDAASIRRDIRGHCVLVTGGGGSIGREIARQAGALGPSRLVLLDRSENNLFQIGRELQAVLRDLPVEYCVGDIQDERRMREILGAFRPRVIYHAAAYKHVPMMEFNVREAVANNVFGTRQVAQLAREFGVERFVLISTDKAVHPVSVMGKTKRTAEILVQSLNGGETRFISVRFGNVLGSDGSVVPIFREQIAAGGPVTVTHPDATRYFMTIPEAVQLVMQAGAMGRGGEIFMLDMGRPVRIVDLARNMIELSGLRPEVDVDIVFTGLRPGEKLHEELNMQGEQTLPTTHEKIVVLSTPAAEPVSLGRHLGELRDRLHGADAAALAVKLSEIVDLYAPRARAGDGAQAPEAAARLREAFT